MVEKDGRKRDRGGTRRKLGLHGGLEYLPTPTDWLHHRHRLHLLCPTSYLPILDAYPAPSGWRHAQDASGIKLLGASLFFTLLLLLLHLLLLLPLLLLLLFGKLLHLHHASLSLLASRFLSRYSFPRRGLLLFFFFLLFFLPLFCSELERSSLQLSFFFFFSSFLNKRSEKIEQFRFLFGLSCRSLIVVGFLFAIMFR